MCLLSRPFHVNQLIYPLSKKHWYNLRNIFLFILWQLSKSLYMLGSHPPNWAAFSAPFQHRYYPHFSATVMKASRGVTCWGHTISKWHSWNLNLDSLGWGYIYTQLMDLTLCINPKAATVDLFSKSSWVWVIQSALDAQTVWNFISILTQPSLTHFTRFSML